MIEQATIARDAPRRERYQRAVAHGSEFLRARQRRDGSVSGCDSIWGYYSQPIALHAGGGAAAWNAANRCLDHVDNHFRAGERLTIESLPLVGDLYPYPYLIRGALVWERHQIAARLIGTLLESQFECGGVAFRIDDPHLVDPAATAHGALSLVAAGRLDAARRAGDLVRRMHDEQPDPTQRYLIVWDVARDGLLDDYTGLDDVPWGSGSILVADNPNNANAYWDIGFMIALMCSLHAVTGEPDYLRVGREMFYIFLGYRGFDNHVWKTPWGCAALYQSTRDPRVLEVACRMADEIVAMQQPDGGFFLGDQSNYVADSETDWSYGFSDYSELGANVPILLDTAAQMTYYLARVASVLPD